MKCLEMLLKVDDTVHWKKFPCHVNFSYKALPRGLRDLYEAKAKGRP